MVQTSLNPQSMGAQSTACAAEARQVPLSEITQREKPVTSPSTVFDEQLDYYTAVSFKRRRWPRTGVTLAQNYWVPPRRSSYETSRWVTIPAVPTSTMRRWNCRRLDPMQCMRAVLAVADARALAETRRPRVGRSETLHIRSHAAGIYIAWRDELQKTSHFVSD